MTATHNRSAPTVPSSPDGASTRLPASFHPATSAWFDASFAAPTDPQLAAWPAIKAGQHTLIAAPTGSGKTLAAFLSAIDDLAWQAERGELTQATQVVYVSPLKALSNDIEKNLRAPLQGVVGELEKRGIDGTILRAAVRTGDTPSNERQKMLRRPPHIVVTTPESLHILLTTVRGREMLGTVRTVIVDEIHALVRDKRGSHLSLTLERLQELVEQPLVRIGLSATQKPIENIARFLVGARPGPAGECTIVDVGHKRALDLQIEVPESPLETVMSGDVREEVYDRLAELIGQHKTTLLFMNTRRSVERYTKALAERLGDEAVTSHHGSLSKEHRLRAEQRLKAGELRALVATASLEMGIDVGSVELVCQVGSPRSIAAFLQRIGRAGHSVGALPKGRLFPLSRDDLAECCALFDAIARGELDRIDIPVAPMDILAQQVVAACACRDWDEAQLLAVIRRAQPYRDVTDKAFEQVLAMLGDGFSTRRGRRGRWLHRDKVNKTLRGRKGARLAAVTSGGSIPDNADYRVLLEPAGLFVGTLNEDFAIESMPGDIFQLGNQSWRIARVEPGKVRVEDAHGQPPTIPFWLGEAPARTIELSAAVARVREEIAERATGSGDAAVRWLVDEVGVALAAAQQVVTFVMAEASALGVVPTQRNIVLERFFDSSGGMQLVLHAPFGARINRAWGLALRKRFCKAFNFELQAAATDNAVLLSLGATHSFPLDDVFGFLNSNTVREVLIQAMLDAPMFEVRWRWNAGRALAVLRFRGGKKVAPQLQRMQAQDLIAVVFPDQIACQENVTGAREVPDHPLVNQTVHDCLTEAMDIERLEALLRSIEAGERNLVARDTTEPSPFALEVVNAMPYAFLDDAPLEERRTQAVIGRRWLSAEAVRDLQALDAGAIERVREEAFADADDPEELHDALVVTGFFAPSDLDRDPDYPEFVKVLQAAGRVSLVRVPGAEMVVPAERMAEMLLVHPGAMLDPPLMLQGALATCEWDRAGALRELIRNRLEALGPVTAAAMAASMGVGADEADFAFVALESEGFAFRGHFTPAALQASRSSDDMQVGMQWCDRRLLARIHRYTIDRMRREIEPVNIRTFMRFLLQWQGVDWDPDKPPAANTERVLAMAEQLEGFEAAAAAWEGDILPARLPGYDPVMLDGLCLSGRVAWARLTPGSGRGGPIKATPIALYGRRRAAQWFELAGQRGTPKTLSSAARTVAAHLEARGACFFDEIEAGTPLLKSQVETALAELVGAGLCASDGFVGLRALLTPSNRRPRRGRGRSTALLGMESAGRWTMFARSSGSDDEVPAVSANPRTRSRTTRPPSVRIDEETVEMVAWTLLRRYGVVCRRLLTRENRAPTWRQLVRVYHRLEARGEVRGGRFIGGLTGVQFALPEAVGALRKMRRTKENGRLISISAADPLNLVGVLLPGDRVTSSANNRVLYRDGEAVAVLEGDTARILEAAVPSGQGGEPTTAVQGEAWLLEKALRRRRAPPQLRAYLGR